MPGHIKGHDELPLMAFLKSVNPIRRLLRQELYLCYIGRSSGKGRFKGTNIVTRVILISLIITCDGTSRGTSHA
jgi:hypothetical protein